MFKIVFMHNMLFVGVLCFHICYPVVQGRAFQRPRPKLMNVSVKLVSFISPHHHQSEFEGEEFEGDLHQNSWLVLLLVARGEN